MKIQAVRGMDEGIDDGIKEGIKHAVQTINTLDKFKITAISALKQTSNRKIHLATKLLSLIDSFPLYNTENEDMMQEMILLHKLLTRKTDTIDDLTF